MNTYADDLAELLNAPDLTTAALVGHSTGGGEVVRYLARRGSMRVAKAVLISAVPPIMVKAANSPIGTPIEALDVICNEVATDGSQYHKDLSSPFFGYNRTGAKTSEGVRNSIWLQGMESGVKGSYDCIKAFSTTDFNQDLKAIDVPTLVMHGDVDQIVPSPDAGALTAKLVKGATLKACPGYPYGMPITHADVINPEILSFLKS